MTAERGFRGYTLTDAERASATGVRIVLEETEADTAAREAAQQPGDGFDAFAPLPGSGVGSGDVDRLFALTWELRDITRSTGEPVTADTVLNTPDEGVVNNSVELTGTPIDGGNDVTARDDDTITIINQPPGTSVAKSVTPTEPIFTPVVGTPEDEYPTATWRLEAENTSTAKASVVRIIDPATCSQVNLTGCATAVGDALADPFDTSGATDYLTDGDIPNAFDRFTVTGLTIAATIGDEIDDEGSIVWLLRYADGAYSTTSHTIAEADALSEAELADVVGLSVAFRGVSDAGTGTITQENQLSVLVDTRLRATVRSSGENLVLRAGETVNVTNRVFAQSYDPVLAPETTTGDVDNAGVVLTGGVVNITPTKSVSPASIAEPGATGTPVTVTLGATQGTNPRSTLSPNRVVIEDQADSPDFWNTFDFVGVGTATLPAGADRVQVDVFDGDAWLLGTPAATAALPAETVVADVQGIRFTFTRADGGLFSQTLPAAPWTARAPFTVELRETYRDSGEPVTFDQVVENTQTSQSTRDDGNDSDPKSESAEVELTEGTHELAVNKLSNNGNRLVTAGTPVPFDLTFQNIGTGFLTLTGLDDVLPASLEYLDTPATVFTADPDGLLSDDVTVTLSDDGRTVSFAWPEGGNVMAPGETFSIRLYLELQPGLSSGERATNTMVVGTEENLDTCRNIRPGGSTTGDWAGDPTSCGTTDYVSIVAGPNLVTIKGVRGSLEGAYRPSNPSAVCAPTVNAAGEQYFRSPCVANSEVDGTDKWVLHNVNAGTVPVEQMTIFDQLPTPGDSLLISGNDRGSQFRPELVADSLGVTAPPGTTRTIQVTATPDVCVGTWGNLTTQPVCEQSGEDWKTVGAVDAPAWADVTGIRVVLDFRTTAARALAPGQSVDVTFSTVNRLEGADRPDGASAVVPATDERVWNQYGVKYKTVPEAFFRKIAPAQVGSHLRFGSIAVEKVVTGPAAEYAPTSFQANVVCTIGDTVLDLGDAATVTLNAANDYTARIDGIPISASGTECTVTEVGDIGEYGETSRLGSPTTLLVDTPAPQGGGASEVPTGQIATLTNDYQFTGLSITKTIDTEATEGSFGPFTFTLSCTSALGDPVLFDGGATELTFQLEANGTWSAPADRIPVGASCVLSEVDGALADDVVFTGSNVADNGDGTATITPGVEDAEVTVTNGYDAGIFTVGKIVDGEGAALYGDGPFSFTAVCTYGDQVLLEETFELRGGDTSTFGTFPTGTECAVSEQTTGGATSTALDPADGTVTIVAAEDGGVGSVAVNATNTFDLAAFDVVKERDGNALHPGAAGPFTVVAVCTLDVDGTPVVIDVPGGAERVLSAENGYRTTYADLPVGADCTVTETDAGFAASTSISIDGGEAVPGMEAAISLDDSEERPVLTVTNTFAAGEISVLKRVSGLDASAHRDDTFTVLLTCTWQGEGLEIPGGAERALTVGEPVVYSDLPPGAECVIEETEAGGASRVGVSVDGATASNPAELTVADGDTVEIVFTNAFDGELPNTGVAPAWTIAILGAAALLVGLLIVGAAAPARRRD